MNFANIKDCTAFLQESLDEWRKIRHDQDIAYEESLKMDREKVIAQL